MFDVLCLFKPGFLRQFLCIDSVYLPLTFFFLFFYLVPWIIVGNSCSPHRGHPALPRASLSIRLAPEDAGNVSRAQEVPGGLPRPALHPGAHLALPVGRQLSRYFLPIYFLLARSRLEENLKKKSPKKVPPKFFFYNPPVTKIVIFVKESQYGNEVRILQSQNSNFTSLLKCFFFVVVIFVFF